MQKEEEEYRKATDRQSRRESKTQTADRESWRRAKAVD